MTDHVYLCRDGENEELRFSLRSLARFVAHDRVWIVGGWPGWVSARVNTVRNEPGGTKHARTTSHLRLACLTDDISDPFVMWNDDFFATAPVHQVPVLHNGPLVPRMGRGSWYHGQRATERWLRQQLGGRVLMSYELHVPLVVHKQPMLEALGRLGEIEHPVPHKRTVYGNLAGIGGIHSSDVKVWTPRAEIPIPWVSSSDGTFARAVRPRLGLGEPGPYET